MLDSLHSGLTLPTQEIPLGLLQKSVGSSLKIRWAFFVFTCFPVTTFQNKNNQIQIEGTVCNKLQVIRCKPDLDFFMWEDSFHTEIHGSLPDLLAAAILEPIFAVSDGSVRAGHGAAAWLLTTASAWILGNFISVAASIPLEVEVLDSHRTELYGLLGINHTYIAFFGGKPTFGTIVYACDNYSALMFAFNTTRYSQCKSTYPDYDIIEAIRETTPLHTTIAYQHVKGHQDTNKHTKLSFLETLNVFVDQRASEMCKITQQASVQTCEQKHRTSQRVHWQLWIRNFKIIKNIQNSIYDFISSNTMEHYYTKRRILEPDTFIKVDWKVHSKAMLSIPFNQRHWITKHTFGFCGVNRTLMQWGQRNSASCARCDAEEATTHVWRCPHHDTQGRCHLFLSNLEEWPFAQHTCPELTECLLRKLSSWSGNHTNVNTTSQQRYKAELAQDIIGWNFSLEGLNSQSWAEAQTLHFHL